MCNIGIIAALSSGIYLSPYIFSVCLRDWLKSINVKGFWCLAGYGTFVLAEWSPESNRCHRCHFQQSPERPVWCTWHFFCIWWHLWRMCYLVSCPSWAFRAADGALHWIQFLASTLQRLKQQCVRAELSSAAKPPCHMGQASFSSWALLHSACHGLLWAVAYPSSQSGFGLCRLLSKCLCFVRWGLEDLTSCWLLPECPFRLGLLLPLVLRGVQSLELDSSSEARSKKPRRQTRLLKDQTSVWKSGLQTGLR